MFTTLRDAVDEITVIRGAESDAERETYAVLAKQAVRKMNLSIGFNIKSEILTVEGGTIKLPSDYMEWSKVALCINGWYLVLNEASGICLGNKEASVCEELGEGSDDNDRFNSDVNSLLNGRIPARYHNVLTYDFANVYKSGQFVGGIQGIGAGYPSAGFFRVGSQSGLMHFSSEIPDGTDVVVEYKSTGVSDQMNVIIPNKAIDLIIAWVDYDREKRKSRASRLDAFRQDYKNAFRAVMAATKGCSLTDWNRAYRKTKKMSPNR